MDLLADDLWTGKVFVNEWTTGSGATAPVTEPATGEVLGQIGLASSSDVLRAAAHAAAAQKEWAARTPGERAAILRRAGQLWEQHAQEIERWIVRETGSIPAKAQ